MTGTRVAPLVALLLVVAAGCGAQPASGARPGDNGTAHAGAGSDSPTNETPVASAVGTPQPAPPIASLPTVTPPPTLTGPAALSKDSNGATVKLRVGQSVTVSLAYDGLFSWYPPKATGTAIRLDRAGGGYPAKDAAWAVFTAIRPGIAALSSFNDTACLHATPRCLPPQENWQVTVNVAAP
jgi:hypothetical protein